MGKSQLRSWPVDMCLSDALKSYATAKGLDAAEEWEAFKDYHEAHGSRFASWPAAWRTWCRNAVMWRKTKPIGFVMPKGTELEITGPIQPLDDYTREVMNQTPKQRAQNLQKLKAIIGSIK